MHIEPHAMPAPEPTGSLLRPSGALSPLHLATSTVLDHPLMQVGTAAIWRPPAATLTHPAFKHIPTRTLRCHAHLPLLHHALQAQLLLLAGCHGQLLARTAGPRQAGEQG